MKAVPHTGHTGTSPHHHHHHDQHHLHNICLQSQPQQNTINFTKYVNPARACLSYQCRYICKRAAVKPIS